MFGGNCLLPLNSLLSVDAGHWPQLQFLNVIMLVLLHSVIQAKEVERKRGGGGGGGGGFEGKCTGLSCYIKVSKQKK